MKHKPIPAMAGPKYVPTKSKALNLDDEKYMALRQAYQRSERQPKLMSMNSKEGK